MERSETPGLKRSGTRIAWVCTPAAREAGYPDRYVNLAKYANDPQGLALACQMHDARQRMFMAGKSRPDTFDPTIAGIIKLYQTHDESPFHSLQETTKKPYDIYAQKLVHSVGTRRIDRLTGLDVMRWHKAWREPAEPGEREKLGAATMALNVLKSALSFAVASGVRDAAVLLTMIRELSLPKPRPRIEAPTAAQVQAARSAAHALGHPGAALAYAIQFEAVLRQYDVAGKWVPLSDPRPSDILFHGMKWIGPRWSDVKAGILDWTPQKTAQGHGKSVRVVLSDYPMIIEELSHHPESIRHGPLIKDTDGIPYRPDAFRKLWTKVRAAAGIPAAMWNRDFRAGGMTEGSNAGVSTDDLSKAAANSPRVNRNVYQRDAFEAARRMAEKRKANRA